MFLIVDTLVMAAAYWSAFFLRFDFHPPWWGWRAVAISFITVWAAQAFSLAICGCSFNTRRLRPMDVPRYCNAALLSAAILTALRFLTPLTAALHVRPPYSITLIDMVFFAVGILASRFVWTMRAKAKWREAELLSMRGRAALRGVRSAAVDECLRGACVMVTGAGGSIGSEIVRQVASAGAKTVLMVERGENALYQIDREMAAPNCIPLMRDINDVDAMRAIFDEWHPTIVLHAAAYKHVPMVEANPEEGWRNNAEATKNLAAIAKENGVKCFVLISTDKAVNPVSVMGRTKRAAEEAVLALGYRAVRFGNVFGSSGSVVPLWREQIARGGPVTVTDRRMTRYFMSVEEAVALVLEAAAMSEAGCVYVLDMGRPVSILRLAEEMIRHEGFRPYKDIPIEFTGIRPGEKLVEELGIDSGDAVKTDNAKIFRVCG